MITYKTGDILKENVEAIVNTVNCVGVMGRGIALQFKKAFPENFKSYAAVCKKKELQPGSMFVFEPKQLINPKYIINFPTKRHWRGKSRLEDIESGLSALVEEIRTRQIKSIAIPPLGAGLGGLPWIEVKKRILGAFSDLSIVDVVIFEPSEATADQRSNKSSSVPKMTAGRAALIELMNRYLRGLLDPSITLLELHKLMYFMQHVGEPLKLNYVKGPYGPYAKNLRHVLSSIEGHLVSGYADGGDAPDKQLSLVPGALTDAQKFLESVQDTQEHLEKVTDLVDGFESSFGLELLSTVHWLLERTQVQSLDTLVNHVYGWNNRKKQFSRRQIKLAVDVLSTKGWCRTLLGDSSAAKN